MTGNDQKVTKEALVSPHVDSFNSFLGDWLELFPRHFRPLRVTLKNGQTAQIKLTSMKFGKPKNADITSNSKLLPVECRLASQSYSSDLNLKVNISFPPENGTNSKSFTFCFKGIPIMIKSKNCHLKNLTAKELISLGEEEDELGGYFIVRGRERIIRLLLASRRNFPMLVKKKSFKSRGKDFTDFAVMTRSVREDYHSVNFYGHYLRSGKVVFGFLIRRKECLLPAALLLKCFKDQSDKEIFEKLMEDVSERDFSFFAKNSDSLLRSFSYLKLNGKEECLEYLGSMISKSLSFFEDFNLSNKEVAEIILKEYILVHCYTDEQKYEYLITIIKRLFQFVNGTLIADKPDTLNHLEALLPGQIFSQIVGESISNIFLRAVKSIKSKKSLSAKDLKNDLVMKEFFKDTGSLKNKIESFLLTGNIVSKTDFNFRQYTGFTISTERINYLRFISHFRSIHRGQSFLNIKTTDIRKLLPEFWGFICPVHTPDGNLCGLLNHLAASCTITTKLVKSDLFSTLMTMVEQILKSAENRRNKVKTKNKKPSKNIVPVWLNGIKIADLPLSDAENFIKKIRTLKLDFKSFKSFDLESLKDLDDLKSILKTLEIIPILPSSCPGGHFNSIYLSAGPCRFVRPVWNVAGKSTEMIGAFEQLFLNIAIDNKNSRNFSHKELSPSCALSSLAALIPFSDFNQSPRNMYQCQMAKQSMGVPFLFPGGRTDDKTYSITYPQKPLVENEAYSRYGFDKYPCGTNAIVCVIAYTGYDMEDAVIINKASFERGLGHGSMFKTETFEMDSSENSRKAKSRKILCKPDNKSNANLDDGGLPHIGGKIKEGDALLSYRGSDDKNIFFSKSRSREPFTIRHVQLVGGNVLSKVVMRNEYHRNARIGDKFSSRHGQKGTLSQFWPLADMPFTADGIVPDIFINPNAYPSRMTIGMFIESMAGKAGAAEGKIQDGTPFRPFVDSEKPDEEKSAVGFFGEKLVQNGFEFYGNDEMYSGLSGEKMETAIFTGVVYYQRLRHMILDKSQVRSLGPIDRITKQPVKGRKNRGGIRFGEMERDSLLAHGCAFLLKDRMLNCSDHHIAVACKKCKSLLSTQKIMGSRRRIDDVQSYICNICKSNSYCVAVEIPYCLVFLLNELASVNIKMALDLESD